MTPDLVGNLWYDFNFWIIAGLLTGGFSLRTRGERNVPRRGPVLLVANHESYIDPIAVGLAARRRLYYLARKSLFRNAVFGRYLRSVNSVPVDQEGLGIEGLRTVAGQLKAGHAVLVFPEGSRTPDGHLQPLKGGVHVLVKRSPAPVLPVGIAGSYEAWSINQSLPRLAPLCGRQAKSAIAISIGPPLDHDRLASLPREDALKELYDAIARERARARHLRRRC